MLTAEPQGFFSWNFDIRDDVRHHIAEIQMDFLRDRGSIRAGDVVYSVSRSGILSPFVLEREGTILARAVKRDVFRRTIDIEQEGRCFTLKARSPLRRELALYEREAEIGSVAPANCFSRRALARLPDTLPVIMRLFVIWLTLMLWRREQDTTPAGGGAV